MILESQLRLETPGVVVLGLAIGIAAGHRYIVANWTYRWSLLLTGLPMPKLVLSLEQDAVPFEIRIRTLEIPEQVSVVYTFVTPKGRTVS